MRYIRGFIHKKKTGTVMSKEFRKAFEESMKENDAVLRELAKL